MPTASRIRAYAASLIAFAEDAFKVRGLTMAPFQRERFAILAQACLALANGKKPPFSRAWIEAVKGASKDSDIALMILWLLAFTKVPIDGQVGAGDFEQCDEMRKAARDWLIVLTWLGQRIEILHGRLVCESTGSTITFVAADATGGAHGSRCLLYVINEITHIQKVEFWQTLLDNAVKVDGLTIIATNAGRVGSEAYRLREVCRTSPDCAFHQFCGPVPWQDQRKVEDSRRRNTITRHLRLFEGVWSSGGDALDDADIQAAIDRSLTPLAGKIKGVGFVAGLDLGIKSDHSALAVIGKHQPSSGEATYRLASLRTWDPAGGKVDLESVELAILDAKSAFGLQAVAYDPWQAEFMAQRLRKMGLTMIEVPFSGKNLDLLARNLIEVFRNRVFSMFDCPRLIADLRKLSIVEKSYGYRLEAAADATGHADAATAAVLGLLAARDHCHGGGQSWGGPIDSGPVRSRWSESSSGMRFGVSPFEHF